MRVTFEQAIDLLEEGKVVAIPTETVYGLAARLDRPAAIEEIFALKKRPKINPLIIHIAERSDCDPFVTSFPPDFDRLAASFWPGPLTCILPVNAAVPSMVRAGLSTAGFRIPSHPLTRELLKHTGPLVMPSANLSGRPSSTRADHVEEDFGAAFPVLEGGVCARGVESTIVLYRNEKWEIVRLGSLSPESFISLLGYCPVVISKEDKEKPICPGQFFRHYAPRARLILGDFSQREEAPFILGFRERSYEGRGRVIVLGSLFSAEEVAENLYAALRQLDAEGAQLAWVDMDFPREGLWQTIAERLIRAGETCTFS